MVKTLFALLYCRARWADLGLPKSVEITRGRRVWILNFLTNNNCCANRREVSSGQLSANRGA